MPMNETIPYQSGPEPTEVLYLAGLVSNLIELDHLSESQRQKLWRLIVDSRQRGLDDDSLVRELRKAGIFKLD